MVSKMCLTCFFFIIQAEQQSTNSDERRSSSLRRENRDTVKEISQNGNNGNVSSSKANIAPSTPQKTSRMSNGNMSSGNVNSVIFPLLSDVSVCNVLFLSCLATLKLIRIFFLWFLDTEKISLFW